MMALLVEDGGVVDFCVHVDAQDHSDDQLCHSVPVLDGQHHHQARRSASMLSRKTQLEPHPTNDNSRSSQVAVSGGLGVLDALEKLALNQRLDALLDHVDVGLELVGELADRLGDELRVRELLALPGMFVSIYGRDRWGKTYFMMRTTAASMQ